MEGARMRKRNQNDFKTCGLCGNRKVDGANFYGT